MKFHILVVGFLLILGNRAYGQLVSSFDVNGGFSSLQVNANNFTSQISTLTTVELNYVLKHASMSSGYVMSFSEVLSAQSLTLPWTRFAAGYRYYPLGFNGSRTILDSGVETNSWKATPFIGLNIGLVNLTLPELNASLIEFSPRFGVELPISPNFLLQGQLTYQTATGTASDDVHRIGYQGITGLLGLVLTN